MCAWLSVVFNGFLSCNSMVFQWFSEQLECVVIGMVIRVVHCPCVIFLYNVLSLFLVLCFQRLTIPSSCPPSFADLMRNCWSQEPKVHAIVTYIIPNLLYLWYIYMCMCVYLMSFRNYYVFQFRTGSPSSKYWKP